MSYAAAYWAFRLFPGLKGQNRIAQGQERSDATLGWRVRKYPHSERVPRPRQTMSWLRLELISPLVALTLLWPFRPGDASAALWRKWRMPQTDERRVILRLVLGGIVVNNS